MPTILAIESSCDETAAAVIIDGQVRSNIIATQEIHAKYGGVVPEMASRAHMEAIVPVVMEALQAAAVSKQDLDAVAFTQSPGLIGSLLVGATFAKSLSLALQVPLLAVNHMQAHVLAHFIEDPKPAFPFLCLTVSGGHTQLVLVRDYLDMEIVGTTLDDAAGEAFDKTAKMLGLPYPGGPMIDRYAKEGDGGKYPFPIAQIGDLNYSFSGIKTAILNFLQKGKKTNPDFVAHHLPDICASVQHTIIKTLLQKFIRAAEQYGVQNIGIAGGVSANSGLRQAVQALGQERGLAVFIPSFEYCTDNAAMIAITAHYLYEAGRFAGLDAAPSARAPF
ncbi:MAG: tRNA (adenosine(37)-N6)-threonylcarbamoyltransferase complex transferase subunit TsaD [Sphingobacteriales bacterium]|nr:MAG: tRNA (adenosine(37)-N6)-threonylcarbamoyltransferase complex transferase subunit TsaD [Sphingobacteriales bacterium]